MANSFPSLSSTNQSSQDEEEISTSPGVSEFVSDAFDACNLNQEDLRKGMEQLVLDNKEEKTSIAEGKTKINANKINISQMFYYAYPMY